MEIIQSKPCTKCLRDLPFSAYHKHAKAKYGLRPKCKDCIHAQRTEYYERTQERSREYSKNFYAQNAESVIEYQKKYDKKNADKVKQYRKTWREENREKLLVDKQRDYESKREHYAKINKEYRKAHPEVGRAGTQQRRARKRNAQGKFTSAQWLLKCEFFGWSCYLCHKPLTIKTAVPEHRIPLSRGGANWIANIAPACETCNLKKGSKTETEYRNRYKQNGYIIHQ